MTKKSPLPLMTKQTPVIELNVPGQLPPAEFVELARSGADPQTIKVSYKTLYKEYRTRIADLAKRSEKARSAQRFIDAMALEEQHQQARLEWQLYEDVYRQAERAILVHEYEHRQELTGELASQLEATEVTILEHLTAARQALGELFDLSLAQAGLFSRLASTSQKYGLPPVGEKPALLPWGERPASVANKGEFVNAALLSFVQRLRFFTPGEVPDPQSFNVKRL